MSTVADSKVAKRYASALFAAATRTGKGDAVQRDLEALTTLWQQSPALSRTLESPLIPAEKKKSLIDQFFAKDVDPMTLSFLHLLVDKSREETFLSVQREYRRQADEARGLLRAHAVVAAPLDDAQKAALVSGLAQRTGKQIELDVKVDPLILGGVVVRLEDTVIDGSVRGSLERLREHMLREV